MFMNAPTSQQSSLQQTSQPHPHVPASAPVAPRPESSGFLQEALALLVRTAILFVILEIVLRLIGVDQRQAIVNAEGPYIRDEKLHWALRPHYSRKWAGAQVDINDKGLRNAPLN